MFKLLGVTLLVYLVVADAHLKFPIETKAGPEIVIFDKNKAPTESYRLPSTAVPSNYKLKLTLYLDTKQEDKNFTFNGEVTITFELKADAPSITLHSKNLKIDEKAVILKLSNTDIKEFKINYDAVKDFLHINKSSGNFAKGTPYTLNIKYIGSLINDDFKGFYRSSYMNDKKEKVWLAATHLEPVGARRVFPCFDEPAYKATFDVVVQHDRKYNTTISNTKGKTSEQEYSLETTFLTTPIMSTYLLAIIVSDFATTTNEKGRVSVHARPNAIQHHQFALDTGEKVLTALDTFTNITFEIAKMDQAAIPDFAAGAMGNWGLVLYREKGLLFDENTMTTSEKQSIIEVIAHEFAHQWFGNLISPDWWKFIWLNEGFANFFQSYITDTVDKSWRSVDQSVVKSIQSTAMEYDSGSTTHPINQEVQSPDEINSIFDSISYQKGGAIIRMMQHFLTEDIFKKGLQTYLKNNKHKTATSDKLFDEIQKEVKDSKINVKTIMDKWVNHKGYPVVTVTRDYKNEKSFEIKQERFYSYNATKEEKENDNKIKWHIPINYATAIKSDFKGTTPSHWLTDTSLMIYETIKSSDWIILNKQQTGFYRVNYDAQNWKLIINELNSNNSQNIHILNKAQLADDAFGLYKSGHLKLEIFMNLTAAFKQETDYVAWYPVLRAFSFLNKKLHATEYYPHFKEHVLKATKQLVHSVGFEDSSKDSPVQKLNRIAAIEWGCLVGNIECTQGLQKRIEAWLKDTTKTKFTPDLIKITFCHGLRLSNSDLWKQALNKTVELKSDAKEKQHLAAGLACSNDSKTLHEYLDYVVQKKSPLVNYIPVVLKSIYENSDGLGVDIVLDYLKDNYIHLLETIVNRDDLPVIVKGVASKITTKLQIEKLQHLEKLGVSKEITSKALDSAKDNAKWFETHGNDIKEWVEGSSKKTNGVGMKTSSLALISSLLAIVFMVIQ